MDGTNWEDNPDREILDMAGIKTRHDERGLVCDDDKWHYHLPFNVTFCLRHDRVRFNLQTFNYIIVNVLIIT